MNDDHYYESILPEPWTILGQRLNPLSLGHVILLNALGSPLISHAGQVTVGDLALAVTICCDTYQGAIKAIRHPKTPKRLDKWGKRLSRQKIDWQKKLSDFADYLTFHLSTPDYDYEEGKSIPIEAPSPLIVKVALQSRLGYSEAELMDRSWRLCQWEYLAYKAMEGQVRFQDTSRIEELEKDAAAFFERIRKSGQEESRGA